MPHARPGWPTRPRMLDYPTRYECKCGVLVYMYLFLELRGRCPQCALARLDSE